MKYSLQYASSNASAVALQSSLRRGGDAHCYVMANTPRLLKGISSGLCIHVRGDVGSER
jgi:hypothetical protein